MLFFLLLHTAAALYTHHIFGLETDFYWAAGSLAFAPIKFGFSLYYFLAILSIFIHLAAALHFNLPASKKTISRILPIIGSAVGSIIILTFAGAFYTIEITPEVANYYATNFKIFGVPSP